MTVVSRLRERMKVAGMARGSIWDRRRGYLARGNAIERLHEMTRLYTTDGPDQRHASTIVREQRTDETRKGNWW